MEHIQKYKIEDESLDDQTDNYIYSQNNYSNNATSKNNNNFSKISQNKTIKVTQPKIQIGDLGISSNKKSLYQNSNFIKSDINANNNKSNNNPSININNNFKSLNNINLNNNLQKQNPPLTSTINDQINNNIINNLNINNPLNNSDMNFTNNSEINKDITNPENNNLEENNFYQEIDEIKNTEIDQEENNNIDVNDENGDNAYHHVQIIDEDVENFKRRLDIMVKNFRTDTLKDFMAIKRNLLIEQKTCIENEKQKCDALLSSKSDLIEHLKDDLAKTQKALNSQIIIKEKLVEILFKKNHDKIIKNQKSLAFHGVLMKYHNKKKVKKDKIKKMRKKHWDNYKAIFFKNLKQNWKDMKIYKIVSVKEKACDDKLNEMAQYYGKEINDLRNKLNEANLTIEQSNQAKAQIQENLKKVLMRGVMAMNMEAMNVLDKDVLPKTDISAIADNIMNNVNNISNTTGALNNNISNNNTEGCFTTVNQGLINNNNILNQTGSGVNIKVGVNEDNNLMATVIPANQSFQPNTITFKNNNNNLNSNNDNNKTLLNNTNPINKDSYWLNAPSVPVDIQKNIITTDNKFNREAMVMTVNNNNNILGNIDTEQNNQENDFDDELNSRTYNISPMNPIDTKYINSNHSLLDNNVKMPNFNMNNNGNYFDEMQQNMLGIKNEFSMIKQNQSSMLEEDSLNLYGIGNKNLISNNTNMNSNNKNFNYQTTNNTSGSIRSNSKKGKKIDNSNVGNKKGGIKNNNKIPPGGKNNSGTNKKVALNSKNKK